MPLAPGTRLGPYEILAPIGAGGMGEVYRATDTKLGRSVALKVLSSALASDADYVARFTREAQVLASLNHPNIAAIYGLEESDGVRAIVMELVEGLTLAERISAGAVPLEEAIGIAKQMAEGLEAAHEKGVIHRDLKPANVKITPEGVVKVLDFGLAKAAETYAAISTSSPTLTMRATQAGVIMGTAGYMSPEQAAGKAVDRRADIWAFGVVLWEMLTGRALFTGETVAHTLADVLRAEIDVSKLQASAPSGIRELVRRCLDRNVKTRLRDIGEARIVIEQGATEEPAPQTVNPEARRAVLPWISAGAAVICSLILAFLFFRQPPSPERVIRYSMPPPEKTRINEFALSPDGRYLAMTATGANGKRQLWIRAMDALAPHALADTEEAFFPFWSPDSSSIGFFARNKLKKVSAGGGPIQTLCDANNGRGGDWSRQGVIVFGSAAGPLQRVAAAGGMASPVTTSDSAMQAFPVFLPDGRRFFFVSARGQPGKSGIYVASLDSPQARRVLADVSSAAWLPPQPGSRSGHVLFLRQNTLMAQPLDPDTLQPSGDVFPVADQASLGPNNNELVSISGPHVLVYLNAGNAGQSQLTWVDRSGKALGIVGIPGYALDVTLAPDERTLALSRGVSMGSNSDIWLHELARGAETRFTFHPSNNFQPIFSPDGQRILFSSLRAGQYDLYLKDSNGAGTEEMLLGVGPSGRNKHPTDWSRDGKFLLYTDYDAGGGGDLWVLPSPGSRAGAQKPEPFLRTEFYETQGQFSPDSHWIAYASDESGRFEIYVRPFPVGAGKWRISLEGGQLPRWRRDGKELFFLSPENKLMAVAVKGVPGAQPVFEAAAARELFDAHHIRTYTSGLNSFVYAVSADGKRFLLNTSMGNTAVAPLTVVVNWLAAVKK